MDEHVGSSAFLSLRDDEYVIRRGTRTDSPDPSAENCQDMRHLISLRSESSLLEYFQDYFT